MNKKNIMHEIEIEKLVFNCGAVGEKLEKSVKLLKTITGRKICKSKSTKRIPDFGISPGKESGCRVTIREKDEIHNLLKRIFAAEDNKLPGKQITTNQMAMGIREYIEIPGLEYDRDIGILGFEICLVFKRKGKRVINKKVKKGKYPKRQAVTKEEITEYLIKNFNLEITTKNDRK